MDNKPHRTAQDLPLELLEEIASHIATSSVPLPDLATLHIGPTIRNPFRQRDYGSNRDLVAFAATCKAFRFACLRYLPNLVRDISFTSFGELERIQYDKPLRERLRPYVRHISLDFSVPVHVSQDRLRQALVVLCIHPSLTKPCFPQLEGLSFSSRFLSSYSAHGNVRRDWQQVARESFGLDGWQAKLVGGLASVSSVLSGGQNMVERFGDAETLLLRWKPEAGEGWDQRHDLIFQQHFPQPLPIAMLPDYPARLLITLFPPSTPRAPPLLMHPAYHVSHFLVSRLLTTPKHAVSSPLRPFAALHERVQNAYALREFDEKRANELGLGTGGATFMFDERMTAIATASLVNQIVFTFPEPSVLDAIEGSKVVEPVEGEEDSGFGSGIVNAWKQFAS